MKDFISAMDNLPMWAKILLAIPMLDVVWVVYRLCKSIESKNTLNILLAVILIVIGIPFLWIVDIISLILTDKVLWLE
jgi:hypothetical protein